MDFQGKNEINETSPVVTPKSLVMVAANTGGPEALAEIIPKFPPDTPACVVVMLQMRPGFTTLLSKELDADSGICVREAEDGMLLASGEVVIISGNSGAQITRLETIKGVSYRLDLDDIADSSEKRRSKIDQFFQSGASAFETLAVGVILTGAGDDGVEGLRAVSDCGGFTIAQNEASSVIFDMPRASINANVVKEVLPLYNVAGRILEVVRGNDGKILQKAAG